MKARIIGKYFNHDYGIWYALIYRYGIIYTLPYNLAIAN